MIKISIGDLIALCEEFDVKFSLQETEQLGYRHLMYTFGPISFLTDLYEEFTGFICRINFASPVEIECEGYSYELRKNTYLKNFKNVKLIQVLRFLLNGNTSIKLDSENVADFPITSLNIANKKGTEVLEMIKQKSENAIFFYFTGQFYWDPIST